ncbi:MAG TPA: phosphoribosyltransferase [Phototrophicaceae bacterium]|nr:phosphoribosyltransferase [Phototrophicaceae bacterium]
MTDYTEQVKGLDDQINAEFWKNPKGVEVEFDPLKFLYVPDHVMTFIASQMARAIYRYQIDHIADKQQITHAVMITMGGMLPGVLLHDHLAWTLNKNIPPIAFGTMGVKFYAGPGQPLDEPRIMHELSIEVNDKVVGVIEDLVDLGGTARFVAKYLKEERGAKEVVLIAPYLKSAIAKEDMEVISYGNVPKDTWIIMPREKVETLVKRVPYWRDHGATLKVCEDNLVKIGYPRYMIDIYLRPTYERG